ncbi:MAG: hypothetical protein AAF641_08000 [Pseudomonadota bacterium]
MSKRSLAFALAIVISLGVGFFAGSTFQQLRSLGQWLKTFETTQDAEPSLPSFAKEEPTEMRRALWPENVDVENPDFALILTANATGDLPVLIDDGAALREHALSASVTYDHINTGQRVGIALFTLGQGLGNFTDYAHLIHDGAVIETLRCWQCNVTDPEFRGTKLTALIAAGRPVSRQSSDFSTEDAFSIARDQAAADPDVWIDTTKPLGRQRTEEQPLWTLTTWRRVNE